MEKNESGITEERSLSAKHLTDCMKATILYGKRCPNFSDFHGEPKEKYPRCLIDEYIFENGQKFSLREAKKLCPFFDPKTIETKCIFYLNYYRTEEEKESEIIDDGQLKYINGVETFLRVRLEPELKIIEEDKEKKYEYRHLKTLAKRIIQMQSDLLKKHLGMSPEPPPRYATELENEDSFKKWMERTAKKITR